MALSYQTGFCNEFANEALPHALPALGNSPQRCPYRLALPQRQRDYTGCWRQLPVRFSAQRAPSGCGDPLAQLG